MFARIFGELGKDDSALAGGKGASLGEMTQAGIPVPPGFVVLSGAFEHFLEETDLNVEIDNILHGVDHSKMHTVEHASETIQSLILKSKMPADIAAEALADFRDLGAPYVAVRSSATAEDSASAAWAGQLDSFLNTTEETLLRNIQRCWASLFTPRAIFYRFEQGLHESKISVAVVVQKMVASEVSGIAFSVHPVTEDRNQLIIEAGFGLGEAIVSGQITPDSYVVEKSPRRIIDKNIADQARGIYRKSEGGNEWIPIPQEKRNLQKLSGEQILELSDFILRIEQHYGFPCDIEWAYEDGKFYIVQSRPITTLDAPTEENIIEKDLKFELTFKEYHPPLWLSLWINDEYLKQYRNISGTDVGVFYIVKDDQFEGHIQVGAKNILYEALKDRLSDTFFENLYDEYSTQMKRLYDLEKELEADRNYTAEELIRYLEVLSQATAKIYPMSNALYLLSEAIEERANGKLKESGFDTSVSAYIYPKRATYLGQHHVDAVALKERYFKDTQPSIADVENVRKSDPSFGEAFSAFAAKYAYLTALNLGKRTPESFIPDIASAVHTGLKREPEIPSVIQTEVEYLSHILFFKDEISTYVVPYTKFAFERLWDNCAQTLRCSIAELQELHIPDIQRALRGEREGMKELMDKRRQATLYFHVSFDDIETSEGDEAMERVALLKARYIDHLETPDQNVISGKIGCHGYARGVVKIIRSSREIQQFQEGQVLVTEYTAPEFVPAMKKALAVVTDTGGATSHAAIVSRELGVPCVVGTKIATQVLHDGDLVEVDADRGVVTILQQGGEQDDTLPNVRVDGDKDSSVTTPQVLSKFFERDGRPLMYMMIWYQSDKEGLERFTRQSISHTMMLVPPKGRARSVWYDASELAEIEAEALKRINADSALRKRMIEHTESQWQEIVLYLRGEKKIEDVAEFGRLYDDVCAFWYAMSTIYFRLPDHTDLDAGYKRDIFRIRDETQEYSQHMAMFLKESFERLLPEYARFSDVIAAAEIPRLAAGADDALVDELEMRVREGAFILDGVIYPMSALAKKMTENNLMFETVDVDVDEFSGAVAYRGHVKGVVRVITGRHDLGKVRESDVIVSVLTEPDYVPAMQKAAAFVTDEGGVMCHAAIVARELKKPCIIGTKIATQVLKDGDLVEVDADSGVVRVLEKAGRRGFSGGDESLADHDWELWIRRKGLSPFWTSLFHEIEGELMKEAIGGGFEYQLCIRNGDDHQWLRLPDDFDKLRKGIREFITGASRAQLEDLFLTAQSMVARSGTLIEKVEGYTDDQVVENFNEIISELKLILLYTTSIPYFLLDTIEKEGMDEISHAEFVTAESEKLRATSLYHDLELRVFDRMYRVLAEMFHLNVELIPSLSIEEVTEGINNSRISISDKDLEGRERCMLWTLGFGSPTVFSFDDEMIKAVERKVNVDTEQFENQGHSELVGTVAFRGVVKGVVRVVNTPTEMGKLQPGEILVAHTTNPSLMHAIAMSGAIVTDEGGMGCHAAIVARELKKPCIIGTKIATQVLHDGDLVEVDADRGIVIILKK